MHTPKGESTPDTEILIGRLVDREPGHGDEDRFREIAGREPDLWRRLAERLMDMATLGEQFEHEVSTAMHVDLPARRAGMRPGPWTLSLVGWAALLIVTLSWATMTLRSGPDGDTVPAGDTPAPVWSPDDHLQEYMRAPSVIGEMAPAVLEVEELSDGRLKVYYLRRIEETAIIDAGRVAEILGEDGRLTVPPSDLRGSVKELPRED